MSRKRWYGGTGFSRKDVILATQVQWMYWLAPG
jgi:hypothetical protein